MWVLSQADPSVVEWSDLLLGPLGALALSLAANVWQLRDRNRLTQRLDAMTERLLEAVPLLSAALRVLRKEDDG